MKECGLHQCRTGLGLSAGSSDYSNKSPRSAKGGGNTWAGFRKLKHFVTIWLFYFSFLVINVQNINARSVVESVALLAFVYGLQGSILVCLVGLVSDSRYTKYFLYVCYSTLPFASRISPFPKTNLCPSLFWIFIVENKKKYSCITVF